MQCDRPSPRPRMPSELKKDRFCSLWKNSETTYLVGAGPFLHQLINWQARGCPCVGRPDPTRSGHAPPPPRQGQTCYTHVQAYDSIFVQDSMTKGPNSPEAKRHRGGRSPTTADEEMTERDQLSIPSLRGASGRGGGGGGDRNSAPRAAPARRITALSPAELKQGFLLHEEQLALLQHQVSVVFNKFPETAPLARSLMKAVREWQAEHKAGTAHPWGSCSHYTAAALLKELSKIDAPPRSYCSADTKYFKKVVQELQDLSRTKA